MHVGDMQTSQEDGRKKGGDGGGAQPSFMQFTWIMQREGSFLDQQDATVSADPERTERLKFNYTTGAERDHDRGREHGRRGRRNLITKQ